MAIKDLSAAYEGQQLQAAGILFVAHDTRNVLTVYRGKNVVDPCCWCGVGGKIENGETPEEAAIREAREEVGYDGQVILEQVMVYETDKLKFTNFIGLVRFQFFPELNWESDGYCWTQIENIPAPMHYGLAALLKDPYSANMLKRMKNARLV